jgi:hypothetical protein
MTARRKRGGAEQLAVVALPRSLSRRRLVVLLLTVLLLWWLVAEPQGEIARRNKKFKRQGSKFGNQKLPANADDVHMWPPPPPIGPKKYNSPDLVIFVLTRRDGEGLHKRMAIRETWAEGYDNVWFMVGQDCTIPHKYRNTNTCESNGEEILPEDQAAHDKVMAETTRHLASERKHYPNLIELPMIDTYKNLPRKLKEAYRWCLENTDAKWLLKSDDDQFIRVELTTKMFGDGWGGGKGRTIVSAGFVRGANVHRDGKWAEKKYKHAKWPAFPSGGAHAVSRDLAQYIVDNSESEATEEFQGEDVSLGVWLHMAPWTPTLATSKRFVSHDGNRCFDKTKYVVGHDISELQMHKCFDKTRAHTAPSGRRV